MLNLTKRIKRALSKEKLIALEISKIDNELLSLHKQVDESVKKQTVYKSKITQLREGRKRATAISNNTKVADINSLKRGLLFDLSCYEIANIIVKFSQGTKNQISGMKQELEQVLLKRQKTKQAERSCQNRRDNISRQLVRIGQGAELEDLEEQLSFKIARG